VLLFRDVEEMSAHRTDHLHGMSRHKIKRANTNASMIHVHGMPETSEQADKINKVGLD
jgi:hypothetical protein